MQESLSQGLNPLSGVLRASSEESSLACLALPFPLYLETENVPVEVSSPFTCEDDRSSCKSSDPSWEAVGPLDKLEGPPWEAVGPLDASAGRLCHVLAATVATVAPNKHFGHSSPACCQSHLQDWCSNSRALGQGSPVPRSATTPALVASLSAVLVRSFRTSSMGGWLTTSVSARAQEKQEKHSGQAEQKGGLEQVITHYIGCKKMATDIQKYSLACQALHPQKEGLVSLIYHSCALI